MYFGLWRPERGLRKPGNPQNAQKGGLLTCIQLFQSTLHVEGCAPRRVLQEGFRRSAAKTRGLGGDPRLKSGGHLLLLLLLHTLHHVDRPNHSHNKIYVHKRDLDFPFNGIYVVYHGLCICARVGDFNLLHRANPRTMGCIRCH